MGQIGEKQVGQTTTEEDGKDKDGQLRACEENR